ncbi:FRG domain-containing protein [Bacillus cereus]|uniref:FRG domain-containing protein n=1 Tax=Bacillus cereus TaxID=1396 RepID=UPI00203F9F10|nr:FRG domain-containing protein [Bacillus cereus]MCM3330162.1 FRG domain-containing protein [Bacillus cereus]MEB9970088.1 FRG domain-containing protein [Bacillus cereus]
MSSVDGAVSEELQGLIEEETKSEGEGVESLSEFIKFVEDLPKDFTLSRGQSQDFPLLPGGLRKYGGSTRKYIRGDLKFFLDEFKVNSHKYLPLPSDPRNDWEWMIYAQHYGVPTRLLDFTYSHMLSVMFAIENAFERSQDGDAVVWFLNPKKLNEKYGHRSDMFNVSEDTISLDSYDGPVAIQGRHLNDRITAQNGVFVYFQDNEKPLEESVGEDTEILRKLVIKEDYLKDVLSSLNSMGIGFSHLYPELASVSKDILMRRYVLEYMRGKE